MQKTIKLTLIVALSIALMAPLFAANVSAIVNGTPDGTAHPYVGMMLFTDGTNTFICSGSLIAPTVFLTAGHCTIATVAAVISFEPEPFKNAGTVYTASASSSFKTMQPYYPMAPGLAGMGTTYDIGIVILDQPVDTSNFATLPTANYASTLPSMTAITAVGYGVQEQLHGKNDYGLKPPNSWIGYGTRMQTQAQIIPSKSILNTNYLTITSNVGNGKGSTMFGDSGGPVLIDNTVLAVTSFGLTYNRGGTSYYSRIDNPAVLDWIESVAGTLLP